MEKFTRLTATACPLDVVNLNTDQILPARYLKMPRAAGLGKVLFHDLRFDAEGRERPDFPLNRAGLAPRADRRRAAAISAAAPRARRRSMRSTITASAA